MRDDDYVVWLRWTRTGYIHVLNGIHINPEMQIIMNHLAESLLLCERV